jgi:nucleoside-diphosphate kinase
MPQPERTLTLLKPETLERGLCGEILRRFEQAGLRILDARRVRFTRTRLKQHYAELRRKNPRAYDRSVRSLTGREGLAVILSGANAIAKVRALVGPTDPTAAPPGTIRGDLSSDSIALADAEDRGTRNLVYAADSPRSARNEIRIWFRAELCR